MNSRTRFALMAAMLTVAVPLAGAQSTSYYQQAAALYDQAAAKCSEPGASCMRQYAAYNRCLAAQYSSGGSCGASPSCSTACSTSSSGGTGLQTSGTASKSTQSQQLAQAVGDLLSQWAAARQAKHEREAEELHERLEQEAAALEAESAAEDQVARERVALLNGDPLGGTIQPSSGQSDDTARLRAQLYAQGQADSSAGSNAPAASTDPSDLTAGSQIQFTAQANPPDQSSVTGGSSNGATLAANGGDTSQGAATQAQLQTVQSDPNQSPPTLQAQMVQTQAAMQPPQNSVFSSAFSQQSDSPADDQAGSQSFWDQMKGNVQGYVDDKLDTLRDMAQPLVDAYHNILNDPSVQMAQQMYSLYSNGNVGAPNATDTPDQMADKVFVPAAMIAPMTLKNGATPEAGRQAVNNGVGTAASNLTTMLGFAAPTDDGQSQ